MLPFRTALLLGSGLLVQAQNKFSDLTQSYCSDQNTGSDYGVVFDIYQSNGACLTECVDNYAFAVVQYQSCWCSNYIPANQVSVGDCSQDCPGYPSEKCGSLNNGLYGYVPLRRDPSGTAGASSARETSSTAEPSTEPVSTSSSTLEPADTNIATPSLASTSSSSSASSATSVVSIVPSTSVSPEISSTSSTALVVVPVITSLSSQPTSEAPAPSSTTEERTTSVPPSTSTSASATSISTPDSTPTSFSTSVPSSSTTKIAPIFETWRTPAPPTTSAPSSTEVSVITTTVSGERVTMTVTSTPVPGASQELISPERNNLSGGAIAGIVVGVILGLAALLLGLVFFYRRKKRQNGEGSQPGRSFGVKRNGSVLSRTGLLSGAAIGSRRKRKEMAERHDADEPLFHPTGPDKSSARHSAMFAGGDGHPGVSPVTPLGSSHGGAAAGAATGGASAEGSERRHSRPLVYDQRLNPSALFANQEANGSRISVQDNQDYSRPLGVANPDKIRPSFESRVSSFD